MHILNLMEDMLTEDSSQAMELIETCRRHLPLEKSSDVICDVLGNIIPNVIENYVDCTQYESVHKDLFAMILDEIVPNMSTDLDRATQQLVLDKLIESARDEEHYEVLLKWGEHKCVVNTKGEKVPEVEISVDNWHSITRRIYSSTKIPKEKK